MQRGGPTQGLIDTLQTASRWRPVVPPQPLRVTEDRPLGTFQSKCRCGSGRSHGPHPLGQEPRPGGGSRGGAGQCQPRMSRAPGPSSRHHSQRGLWAPGRPPPPPPCPAACRAPQPSRLLSLRHLPDRFSPPRPTALGVPPRSVSLTVRLLTRAWQLCQRPGRWAALGPARGQSTGSDVAQVPLCPFSRVTCSRNVPHHHRHRLICTGAKRHHLPVVGVPCLHTQRHPDLRSWHPPAA